MVLNIPEINGRKRRIPLSDRIIPVCQEVDITPAIAPGMDTFLARMYGNDTVRRCSVLDKLAINRA